MSEMWEHEKCSVCGGGFSKASWDTRHTGLDGVSDVHERCCRNRECRKERAAADKLAQELKAARALCAQYPEAQ